jgi:hypothetical protein
MNDRIAELKSQCIVREQRGTNAFDSYMVDRFDTEKFAELIVRECGEVAYKAYWNNPETVRGVHIQEKIKQHFGVEE